MIDTKAPAVDADFAATAKVAVSTRTATLFNALAIAAAALAALLPVALAAYWISVSAEQAGAAMGLSAGSVQLDLATRGGALLLSLLAVAPLSWGLMRARTCFGEFAKGRPFSAKGIAGLRDFAVGMGLSVLTRPLSYTLLSILLSWQAPAGMRQLAIQLDSDTLILALFAAVVASLAWAMQKAAIIAEEHSQFV